MDLSGQTSAQIISEARASLRSVKVSRPITPAPSQLRTLWGDTGYSTNSRPSSVQSVSRVQFVPSHKRPSSGVRLAPIPQTSTPHPPALPARPSSRAKSAKIIRNSHSLEQIDMPPEIRESLPMLELFSEAASTGWKEDRLKNVLASVRSYLTKHREEESTATLVDQISDKLLAPVFKIIQTLHCSPDINSPLLLLACSVAMVAFASMSTLSSTHLTNLNTICQVIFSLARNEKYDTHFADTECTDGMLLLLQQSRRDNIPEYLVYLLGAFKLLVASANSPSSLAEMYLSLVIPLSRHLIQVIEKEEQLLSGSCLLQIAWSLRNLCDSQIALILLTSNESVLLVTNMLKLRDMHETSLYAAKICSKLASNIHFQKSILSQPSALNNLVSSLNSHSHLVTSRLAYTLSMLVMDDINASTSILSLTDGMASILDTVSTYSDLTNSNSLTCLSSISSLIGNLALHPEAGELLSATSSLSLTLISALDGVTDDVTNHFEFLTVLLTALNNLSYYQLHATASRQLTLSLIHLLLLPNISLETIQHAVSCLGNLTRVDACRVSVRESNTDLFLLTLLESADTDLLFVTTGVLINLTSKPEYVTSLLERGLIDKMLGILVFVGLSDVSVTCHSCQIMWNVTITLETYLTSHKEVKSQCEEYICALSQLITSATRSLSEEVKELVNIGNKLLDKLKGLLSST